MPATFRKRRPETEKSVTRQHFALAQINKNQPSSSSHTIVLVTLMNPDTNLKFQVRALLDNGANESYITEKVARRIGLPLGKFRTEPVYVFANEDPITMRSTSTYAYIVLPNGEKTLLNMDTTPELPQAVNSYNLASFKDAYPDIAQYKFLDQGENEPVELLISNDYFWNFIKPESLHRLDDAFSLVNTEFGWTIVRRSRAVQTHKSGQQKSIFFTAKPNTAIDRLCALDITGVRKSEMTHLQSEEFALKEFYANLKFINDRYQIRCPWKEFPSPIETNFGLALCRLRSQQKKVTNALSNEYSYRRFIRVLAHVIRLCSQRSPSFKNLLPKANAPILCAENLWIRLEQKSYYSDIIESIKNKKAKKKKQRALTHKFRLFLDHCIGVLGASYAIRFLRVSAMKSRKYTRMNCYRNYLT